jgi:outer membrane lipoprotein-sorting protein
MKKHLPLILIIMVLAVSGARISSQELTGGDILRRVDANLVADNRFAVGSMVIHGARATRTIRAQTWAQGTEKAFTAYLSPPREEGTKMLKLGDELWTYTPSTDRTIMIAGHMLRQSMSGSDISYEDYMEDPRLSSIYDAQILGEEKIGDRPCHVLKLTARAGQDVAYDSRKLWVDRERFIPLKQELYAKSGMLLKTMLVGEVFMVGERWYPRRVNFKDVMVDGSGTDIINESIQFNVSIPDYIFTKASLRR